jgi:hypothetical protein
MAERVQVHEDDDEDALSDMDSSDMEQLAAEIDEDDVFMMEVRRLMPKLAQRE